MKCSREALKSLSDIIFAIERCTHRCTNDLQYERRDQITSWHWTLSPWRRAFSAWQDDAMFYGYDTPTRWSDLSFAKRLLIPATSSLGFLKVISGNDFETKYRFSPVGFHH